MAPAPSGRTALIVEGGAMRGVYSAGVLDAFLEAQFAPFDLALGVSAGACNLASHLAGQHGRNRRCYFDLMTRRDFIDPRRMLLGRSVVDLDWLWDELARVEPLDVDAVVRSSVELVVVATSARSGQATYLRPTADEMFDALRGSCALPFLYRGPVRLGDDALIDGGVSDPVPVEEAYRLGARSIVVVRSRPAGFVKQRGLGSRLVPLVFRDPVVAGAIGRTAERYQAAIRFATNPPADCRIVQIAPSSALATKRTTQDRGALEADYRLGHEHGMAVARDWATLTA